MKKMTLEEFCSKQFLGGSEKEEFKAWLKFEASGEKLEFEWLRLFNEWLRSNLDKEFA